MTEPRTIPDFTGRRGLLLDAYQRALQAVDPEDATLRALRAIDLPTPVTVCAVGKAAPAMARASHRALGGAISTALVVSDHEEALPDGFELKIGSHPLPDHRSLAGGTALLAAAAQAHPSGSLLVLVSGGGSALAEVPATGLTIEDLATTYDVLIRAAVPIGEVNTVRRHLSKLKNGWLLRASSAKTLTLCVSDVIGAPPSAIASGPTLSDDSTPADAMAVLERHRLRQEIPLDVLRRLEEVQCPPDQKRPHRLKIVADGSLAARAAATALRNQGYASRVVTTALSGDAITEAQLILEHAQPNVVSIATGESTVAVTGSGIGGRNQHAALAIAMAVEGTETVFAALGTDGRDGFTDATGAIIDGTTAQRSRTAGINPAEALKNCDSHTALHGARDLVRTGPTGTNVGDLWMAWRLD